MVSVEPIELCSSCLAGDYDPLEAKTLEGAADPLLRAVPQQPMHLAPRQVGFRPSEDRKNITVEGGRQDLAGGRDRPASIYPWWWLATVGPKTLAVTRSPTSIDVMRSRCVVSR